MGPNNAESTCATFQSEINYLHTQTVHIMVHVVGSKGLIKTTRQISLSDFT